MINIMKSEMNRYSYEDWRLHFERNDAHRLEIDFSEEGKLSEEEKTLIFPSIRAFRKGEGSEGAHLMKTAAAWEAQSGNSHYCEAMRGFIREENWHSSYLKQYMSFHGVKDVKSSFLDHIFRRLRQLGGIRCEITVLVTAEMIALTYYDALSRCTASAALKSICRQMLSDELPHIMFQSYTLSHFQNTPAARLGRIFLMEVTLLFVWAAFHRVYLAGGYSFRRFLQENLGYLRQSVLLSRCP